jgi:hypothetical protein
MQLQAELSHMRWKYITDLYYIFHIWNKYNFNKEIYDFINININGKTKV